MQIHRGRLSIHQLGSALVQTAREYPESVARPEIANFVALWPRYADLERFLRVGNTTFATQVARDLLRDDPGNPPAHAALGALDAASGDWESCAQRFARALERAPNYPPVCLHHALALAASGQRDLALQHLTDLSVHPRYQALARLWLHEVKARTPEDLGSCLQEGMEPFHDTEVSDDVSRWQRLSEALPNNPEVLFARVMQPGGASGESEQERLLERILALDPHHAEATCILALHHRSAGALERALNGLEEFLRRVPNQPLVLAHYGHALEHAGRSEAALSVYRDLFTQPLALLPHQGLTLAGLGLIRLAPLDEASRALEDAAEARPDDPIPARLLARVDEITSGKEAAERRLREAMRRRRPHPLLSYALGDLLRRSGRLVEAEGLFKGIERHHPDSPLGLRGLADLLLTERPGEALAAYARAAERDPSTPIAGHQYLLGVAALREGLADAARAHLRRAVAAEPDNPRFWCDLGAAAYHAGDVQGALAATQRALSFAPRHPGFLHNLETYHRTIFARAPWRLHHLWRAWRVSRRPRAAPEVPWTRDLWQGPETTEA